MNSSSAVKTSSPVSLLQDQLLSTTLVLYVYAPGELEDRVRHRATDLPQSASVHTIEHSTIRTGESILHYITPLPEGGGPKLAFGRKELQVVLPNTETLQQWMTDKTQS